MVGSRSKIRDAKEKQGDYRYYLCPAALANTKPTTPPGDADTSTTCRLLVSSVTQGELIVSTTVLVLNLHTLYSSTVSTVSTSRVLGPSVAPGEDEFMGVAVTGS